MEIDSLGSVNSTKIMSGKGDKEGKTKLFLGFWSFL